MTKELRSKTEIIVKDFDSMDTGIVCPDCKKAVLEFERYRTIGGCPKCGMEFKIKNA